MTKKRPHQYHLTCKHEHKKQVEMCSDCGDIITAPMNAIMLAYESFTSDIDLWVK